MSYLAKNNAFGKLASGISAGATSLTLQAGQGDKFPAITAPDYTFVTLQDAAKNIEIVKVTARTAASDVLTIERSQEGTAARTWVAGDVVECRMTAGLVQTAMAHPASSSGAHAASAVSVTPAGNIAKTNVQAALEELDTEKEPAFSTLGFSKGGTGATSRAAAVEALGIDKAEITITTAINATTDIGAAAGANILLTTTAATITGFATATAGVVRKCRFSTGGVTLTHSASFILPGAANIVSAANDTFEAYSFGSGWLIRNYQKASGQAVVAPDISDRPTKNEVQLQTHTAFTTAGTATAFTLTPTPAIAANAANLRFRVKFHAAAGATPTLAVSGKTAASLKYKDGTGTKVAVTSAQIPINWVSDVEFDGTDWVVLNVPVDSSWKDVGAGNLGAVAPLLYMVANNVANPSWMALGTYSGASIGLTAGTWRNLGSSSGSAATDGYGQYVTVFGAIFQRIA